MILARFPEQAALDEAAGRLAAAQVPGVELYGPRPPAGSSVVPLVMAGSGATAAIGTFLMQAYAGTGGYRIDIGGRPDLFWPAYVPFSIEAGLLAAMLAGFVGFLVAARMPALYEAVDEGLAFASTSQDGWFLSVAGPPKDAVRAMLSEAALVEELPE